MYRYTKGYEYSNRYSQKKPSGTTMVIENLYEKVTKCDIVDLFEEFGPLISARIESVGKRCGRAIVVYKHRKDAEKALQSYNGLLLDGCELQIHIRDQSRNLLTVQSKGIMDSLRPQFSLKRKSREETYEEQPRKRSRSDGSSSSTASSDNKSCESVIIAPREMTALEELVEYERMWRKYWVHFN